MLRIWYCARTQLYRTISNDSVAAVCTTYLSVSPSGPTAPLPATLLYIYDLSPHVPESRAVETGPPFYTHEA